MDNKEHRHGTTEQAPAAAISLPEVAWQVAGEEPAADPATPPPTPPTVAPAPEPAAGAELPGTVSEPARGAVPVVPAASETGAQEAEEATEAQEVAGTEEAAENAQEAAPDALAAAPVAAPAVPGDQRRTRRIPKPMIAAAATSGVVLMGVPFLFSQLGGGSGPGPGPERPAGYNQPDGGPEGFVPGADAPDKGSQLPGAVVPGVAVGSPGPGTENSPVANTGSVPGGGEGQRNPAGSLTGGSDGTPGTGTGGQGSGPAGSPGAGPRQDPQSSDPAPQPPPPPSTKKEYAAVAGPGCSGEGTTFGRNGWYTDGIEGWKQYGTGGHGSSGCNGDFLAMPMSGSSSKDAGNYVLWTFRTGAVTTGTCQVSVHIANNSDIRAVGGKPSYYTVHGDTSVSGPTLGSFSINQPSQLGRWVSGGSFRITGGKLAVKLHDRGQDWSGSTKTYAHHAGSAVRLNCTSSS
ncbi:hypothetical protein ACWFQ8_12165 [Streptomyces sp. NPDC055254]